jgi:hypothetical protein
MHLVLIVLAIITITASAVSNSTDKFSRELVNPHPTQLAATKADVSDNSKNKISVSVKSSSDTKPPEPEAPTVQPVTGYQYPGSVETSDNVYQSSDNVDTVTDWYKAKIRNEGFNVKNFVQTTLNGVTQNKLTGSTADREIQVTIESSPGQGTVISLEY